MFESAIVYLVLIIANAGLVLVVKPIRRLRVTTRSRAIIVAGAGVLLATAGLILPVSETRVTSVKMRLDEFASPVAVQGISYDQNRRPSGPRVRGDQAC